MEVLQTPLPGLLLLRPRLIGDHRGAFMEAFNPQAFTQATGWTGQWWQDNHSWSHAGVLRGLHAQKEPSPQGKLVRVLQGEIYDVAVDCRHDSPTFGHWHGFRLSAENRLQVWLPPGFAHGFLALSAAEVSFKVSAPPDASATLAIRWNDPRLAIDWPLDGARPILSAADAAAPFWPC
ncbi:dTDP-4-dehydrorhamnose 3,5-epimerase [Solimonas sp. K1W22B-7]|uniref:dTDP-4-dehydrorhamnose 3,5-epimerase n=1 Tax=Solimonas sp. K1W22B-7 TaxID=2303331 RepID=UPI000E331A4D|nr:dTDP-4-dehydrorhamnose 3,5-epimerase [Solimonas sp. K1W22B-7]AXQ29895.1 dTDP-4-dehydrorhamnose 3,5-epimerase [Solimonas sp. K1W22B-7]